MNIIASLLAPFVIIGAMFGGMFQDDTEKRVAELENVVQTIAQAEEAQTLGASEAIPTTIAFFETTLASAISDTATSFTLTSATDKDGTTLASSTYAFVIDEGSSNEEIVIADCTGTACTNASRGVSVRTGNTEVTALKKTHRRGASVKITDAPLLPLVSRILRGEGTVTYTPSAGGNLATKTYVDSLALGTTTVAATTLDDGIGELATGVEAASSTTTGNSGSPLFLHTGISTSTAGVANTIPVTGSDGKIDSGFINTSFVTTYAISNASTSVFSTAGTSTYTKVSGLKFAVVEVVGGGGGGGNPGGTDEGDGGGGGGYAKKIYLSNQLSATTSLFVGSGGAEEVSGTASTFLTLTANGGTRALDSNNDGAGGTATGGDINLTGQDGIYVSSTGGIAGSGGYSFLNQYGRGGIGALNGGSTGSGASGVIIITEYF